MLCHSPRLMLCHSPHLMLCHSPHLMLCHSPRLMLCHSPHLMLCHSPHFQISQHLHLQGEAVMIPKPLGSEDEGALNLPGNCLPSDTAHRCRITKSSAALLCKPQILQNMNPDDHWNLKNLTLQCHSMVCVFYRAMMNPVCRFSTTSTTMESSGMMSLVTTWSPSSVRTVTNCSTSCAPVTQASVSNL